MHALLRGGRSAVASHRTAGALLGLDGVPPRVVEIYAPALKSDNQVLVHRSSRLPACDLMATGPLIHTNASRSLLDLAGVVSQDEVEIALECALRRGLTSVPRLLWRLQEVGGRGRPGTATLRKLLDLRGGSAPAQSVLEVRFIQRLRQSSLPPFVRQHEVIVAGGRRRFIDFAFPHALIGIEVGGRKFHAGPTAEQRDARRHNGLTGMGWTLLYFTWDDIEGRIDYVVDCIRRRTAPNFDPGPFIGTRCPITTYLVLKNEDQAGGPPWAGPGSGRVGMAWSSSAPSFSLSSVVTLRAPGPTAAARTPALGRATGPISVSRWT